MKRWMSLGVLGLFTLVLLPAPARADDASLGRSGETVFPIGEATVRMASEEVLLRIGPERTDVDLLFTFANDGPGKQVLMGFPLREQHEGRGQPELNEFLTLVDGVAVPVKTEKAEAGNYPGWMTWEVPFAAGQTRVVKNSYWGGNSFWSNGETKAGYILQTGAAWNGPIGRADVRATLDGVFLPDLQEVVPADYRWDGDDLVWSWREFEPSDDIAVRWNLRPWHLALLAAMPDTYVEFPPTAAALTAYRSAHPNTSGKPDAIDIALVRLAWEAGDHTAVRAGVEKALAAGVREPTLAYLAVMEGLRGAGEFVGWELSPVLTRWMRERAGLPGVPAAPATPVPATPPAPTPEPPAVAPSSPVALDDPRPWLLLGPVLALLAVGLWYRYRK